MEDDDVRAPEPEDEPQGSCPSEGRAEHDDASGFRAAGEIFRDILELGGPSGGSGTGGADPSGAGMTTPGSEAPSAARAPGSEPPLDRLGDFEILRRIGRGGMGEVYLARQASLDRIVALKVLPALCGVGPAPRARILREAKALARVTHPSVVPVHEAGVEDDRPYIAMRYVEGSSLQEVIASGGRLDVRRTLEIVLDIARALEAVHTSGVLHRDIKPGNILVEGDAVVARRSGRPYLTDFGLATIAGSEPCTRSGDVLGTPSYMSPQQAAGEKANVASDVYSLGATMYALLSGRAPHEGTSHAEILSRVARDSPLSLRRLLPSLDRETVLICEKAMRWDPARRYRSAGELAVDVQRRLDGRRVLARPAGPVYRIRVWARRNPAVVRLSAAFLVVSLGSLAAFGAWSRARTFRSVRTALDLGETERASAELDSVFWFPGFLDGGAESLARADMHLRAGALRDAASRLARLPRALRETRDDELVDSIERGLEGASFLIEGGFRWTALRDIREAAGALETIEATEAIAGPWAGSIRRGDWVRRLSAAASAEAERALLDLGRDASAVRLISAAPAPGGAPPPPRLVREVADEALGILDEPAESGTEDLETILDAVLEQDSLGGLHIDGPASSGDSGRRDVAGSGAVVLDRLVPRLLSSEAARLKHGVVTSRRLREAGPAVSIDAPTVHAVGDVDGDGVEEVAIATTRGQIVVLRWCRDGPRLGEGPRVDASESADSVVRALAVGRIERTDPKQSRRAAPAPTSPAADREALPAGGFSPPQGATVIVAFVSRRSIRPGESHLGYLRAFRCEGGILVPFGERYPPPGEELLDATVRTTDHVLRIADLDSDGCSEILVGTDSNGRDEKSVWVIEDPFTATSKRTRLPDADRASDVLAVFAADFDGDGRVEVGAATSVWAGLDLRFWRHDPASASYLGPLRLGPVGAIEEALALELDGRAPAELLLAKGAAYVPNMDLIPERPHIGLRQGLYLFRLSRRPIAPSDGAVPLRRGDPQILWSDEFPETLAYPRETQHAVHLSAGAWERARHAFAVTWFVSQQGIEGRVVDLYAEDSRRGSFSKFRLARRTGDRAVAARLLHDRDEAGRPRPLCIVLLEGAASGDAPWSVRGLAWRRHDPPPPEPGARVEACLRADRDGLGETIAREAIATLPVTPSGIDPAAVRLVLGWAEAARRGMRWGSLDEALAEASRRVAAFGADPAPEGLAAAIAAIERLRGAARRVASLRARDPTVWAGPIEVRLVDGRGTDATGSADGAARRGPGAGASTPPPETLFLDRPVAVPAAACVELSFEVEVASVGYDRGVFIGLRPTRGSIREEGRGVVITRSGGPGQRFQYIAPQWGALAMPRTPELNRLDDGAVYRCALLSTADGRVGLRVERCAGPEGEASFAFWVPPFRGSSLLDDLPPAPGEIAPPVDGNAPGGWRFVVADRSGPGWEGATVLRLRDIRLRLAGADAR